MQEMLQDTDFYQFEELQKKIKEAVDALPPAYREAFVMHRFENKELQRNCRTPASIPKNRRLPDTTGIKAITDHSERLFAGVPAIVTQKYSVVKPLFKRI